jgi:hypothetical protein
MCLMLLMAVVVLLNCEHTNTPTHFAVILKIIVPV